MYEAFFRLNKSPFALTPDPSVLFLSPDHREAIAALVYAILSRKGFVVLTADAGMGKTTVLARVLEVLPKDRIQASVVFHPTLTPNEFLELALLNFGLKEIPASKAQRLRMLQNFVFQGHRQNKVSVLIVDEAHQLSAELLEEIRLLDNLNYGDQKLLQLVLVGQNELDEKLNRYDLRQIKQRVVVCLKLNSLPQDSVEQYIRYRWSKAGGAEDPPFLPAAIAEIARWSHGVPRLINTICDNALLLAFADNAYRISVAHIETACRDLRLETPARTASLAQNIPAATVEPAIAPRSAAAPSAHVPRTPEPASVQVVPPASLHTLDAYRAADKPSFFTRWAVKLGLASQT